MEPNKCEQASGLRFGCQRGLRKENNGLENRLKPPLGGAFRFDGVVIGVHRCSSE